MTYMYAFVYSFWGYLAKDMFNMVRGGVVKGKELIPTGERGLAAVLTALPPPPLPPPARTTRCSSSTTSCA